MGNKWLPEQHVRPNCLILAVSVQFGSSPCYFLFSERNPELSKAKKKNLQGIQRGQQRLYVSNYLSHYEGRFLSYYFASAFTVLS